MTHRLNGRSLWLFQNFYDDLQFPAHTISASSSPTGSEVYRLGTARRSAIDSWSPVTENSTHWAMVDCAIPRPANVCVVDRGHTLEDSSKGFQLEGRSSTTVGWTKVWGSTTTPTHYGPASSTTLWGVKTYEGALLREFPAQVYRYWRFRVPPSTGYAPSLRNLYLGLAWTPLEPALSPSDWDAAQVKYEESATPSDWRGVGRVAVSREGSALYRLTSFGEYITARRHMEEYQRGAVSWWVPRRGRAEEAFCVQIPPVRLPKPQEPGNIYRSLNIPYREHEPLPI